MAAEWVREGLALGEQVLWLDDDADLLPQRLDLHGVDWRAPLRDGRLRVLHPREVVALDGLADVPLRIEAASQMARQSVEGGYAGLRVGVETAVALRVMPDAATQLRLEAAWEQATRVETLSLLCVYDPDVYGDLLVDAVDLHPREYADDEAAARVVDDAVTITGELDLCNSDTVGRFLDLAAARAAGDDVLIDLAACDFVDVAATMRLLRLARDVAPRRVRVLAAPPTLRRVLDLLGHTHELDLVGATR